MSDPILYETSAKPLNPLNALTVRVTASLLSFDRGKLSTSSQQIPMAYVQDVDATQSMSQKARGVGSVVVHVHRPSGVERVQLDDLPDYKTLHQCINDVSRRARVAETQLRQTHHYTSAPIPPQPVQQQPPAAPQASAADEILGQLERLGKLKEAGVLTEEEFQAKKADLLGRL